MDGVVIDHVIADSAAFIRNAKLEKFGKAVYSVPDVVSEIKDETTLRNLQVLPYELHLKEPSPEAINAVVSFAKKVGEFKSLSTTDIKLIALTYQLHVEYCGIDSLKTEPEIKKTFIPSRKHVENPTALAGFYFPKSRSANAPVEDAAISASAPVTEADDATSDHRQTESDEACGPVSASAFEEHEESGGTGTDSEDSANSDEEEDPDADVGWITPANFASVVQQMGDDKIAQSLTVGCVTTDFAMQNVMLHMGLKVLSVDGMLIRRLKTYGQRCIACFHVVDNNVTKRFCPRCGNPTLAKIATTINPDGRIQYHLSSRKTETTRGLRHTLPLPKGGKHAANPILAEDQPLAQNRLSRKALQKLDVFDDSYVTRSSPFLMNDVYSRSAMLGIRVLGRTSRQNPNAWQQSKKRGGKKH